MARALRIGFLVDGLLSRYQVRLFDAIRRAASQRGAMVVGFAGSYLDGADSERAAFDGSFIFELAGPTAVDGIIVASNLLLNGLGGERVRDLCEQSRIPVVSIGPMSGTTTIDVDNCSGLQRVVEHLVVDHGHRRLAFIRGPLTNPDSLERERVFRSTLEALNVEVFNDLIVSGNFLESSGGAAVRTLLNERRTHVQEIDAIVAANDQMATGAMQELAARGLRVPEDIVVVGFDDDDHARSANPPLTTVSQPIERLGQTAVALLIEKIGGRETEERTILNTFPVLRRSCGCHTGRAHASQTVDSTHDLATRLDLALRASSERFEWLGIDQRSKLGLESARDYLLAESGDEARAKLHQLERITLELAANGIDPLQWQDVLTPMIEEVFRYSETAAVHQSRPAVRAQRLFCFFSELATVVLLKDQLRLVELANSLRVIGSAVVCARNVRALGRVLDAGLSSLDIGYCCVCTFTSVDRTRARVAAVYSPAVPRPHGQIHSAEQLWRAIPPTLPPGISPSSMGLQSFNASALLPVGTDAPPGGDFLVFPLMFGDEALGYVILDAPGDARRAWLLEGLSGHLSSAIYEIARTEQLRLARELAEEANSAKTAFVAMMSHEVRTPLNAIMGNLDLCLRTELTKDQKKQLLRAQTSSRALRSIVDDILDYSRVESHRIELESVPFELEEVLEQVVGACAPDASRKNLEFVIDVASDVPERLVGDPLRLTQVLLNLVNNAVKFSTRGHVALRITSISAAPGEPLSVRFSVEDTGIGMNAEQIERIFQPFTQADSSITRRYGGTGLGLTICQRFVELMGGEISVSSALGVGSSFEFAIPLRRDSEFADVPVTAPARILLVVDNPVQREALTRLFEGLGHSVHGTRTGDEALHYVVHAESLRGTHRAFVFADHRLTDMDGAEFASRLRRTRAVCELSLVLLVPHDNDSLLSTNNQEFSDASLLAKPPLRGSIRRILCGSRSSRPSPSLVLPERPAAHAALIGRRILVVQDSEMSRELTSDLLRLNGADVRTATDGSEAIALTTSERFDLVLMDLHLPEVDGYAATRSIRERYEFSTLPIIALSASSAPEVRSRCLEAGMNDFLRAPIGAAELLETVQRWLFRDGDVAQRVSSSPPSGTALRFNAATAPTLDIAKALGRLGGNRALYSQLLRRFAQNHSTGAEELANLLDSGDTTRAANLVHILVSAAGNIGAVRLQHAAQGLEVALRQSHVTRIGAVRPRFELEWKSTIQAVNEAMERHLKGSQPPVESNPGVLANEHIEQLRQLINGHDTAAVELVDSLREFVVTEPQAQQALQRLAQSVTAYDFETAQLHLDALCMTLLDQSPLLPVEIE